jgi:PST family polysaccharide transporter
MNGLFGHRVARNAIALAAIQLVNYAATFLVLFRLTHILSVDTYGVVAFSVGIVQVLSIVLDLGFTMSATQKLAVHRDRKRFVARLAGAVLTVKIAAFLIGAAIICGYAGLTVKYAGYSTLLLLTPLPLLGHALQPVWLFLGIERMRFVTAFIVVAKLLFVALVWLLVSRDSDYRWIPVADGIAQLSAAVAGLWFIGRVGYRISLPRLREVRYALRMTSGFFVSRLSATAYSYSGVVILGLVADASAVAVYSLAEQLYRAMHALFSPVVQSLYPYMARERDFALLFRVALACAGIALGGAIAGHYLAPHLLPAIFGAKWTGALPIIDIFLCVITVHVLAMMCSYPLASALKRAEVANSAVNYGAILYLVGALVLAILGRASPEGLAWLMVVSESYVLLHCGLLLLPAANRLRLQQAAD